MRRNPPFILPLVIAALAATVQAPRAAEKYPIDRPLEGPRSPYTDALLRALKTWPPADIDYAAAEPGPVRVRCIETPGSEYYIGLEQVMTVDAPLLQVEGILEDFAHYKDLFPEFDDVHVVSRDENLIVTFWEQHIPVFFIPNVKYEMTYLLDRETPGRKVFRYQLRKAGKIKLSDGLIVLEAGRNGAGTRYTEYDFTDAEWGALKTFAPGRIWRDSVEGIYLSDVAIKLRAEHPDWSYPRIEQESKALLAKFPVDAELKRRKRFYLPISPALTAP